MRVAILNPAFDRHLQNVDELLESYHTLTGWAGAVRAAGAEVTVVQAFHVGASVCGRTGR